MEESVIYRCLDILLGDVRAYAFMMDVKSLTTIQYVAVRGVDDEEGAVQRVLSPIRVNAIYEYVIKGNIFYTPFILNWTNSDSTITIRDNEIDIPLVQRSAQVIDGQHRIAGLIRAIEKDPEIGRKVVLVIMCQNLNTEDAAKIFLNINTEQKPVQKSLIFDLFGVVNHEDSQMPLVRAKDLATKLNESEDSPYCGYIKFPGNKRGTIGVDLSTVVGSFKPLIDKSGLLVRYNINALENQYNVFRNYLDVIRMYYEKENMWDNSKINPFLTNAGFYGAMEAFEFVFQKCAADRDLSKASFAKRMRISSLLQRADLKSLDGKEQRKKVCDFLRSAVMASESISEDGYKF